jgi:hypothetical protein
VVGNDGGQARFKGGKGTAALSAAVSAAQTATHSRSPGVSTSGAGGGEGGSGVPGARGIAAPSDERAALLAPPAPPKQRPAVAKPLVASETRQGGKLELTAKKGKGPGTSVHGQVSRPQTAATSRPASAAQSDHYY